MLRRSFASIVVRPQAVAAAAPAALLQFAAASNTPKEAKKEAECRELWRKDPNAAKKEAECNKLLREAKKRDVDEHLGAAFHTSAERYRAQEADFDAEGGRQSHLIQKAHLAQLGVAKTEVDTRWVHETVEKTKAKKAKRRTARLAAAKAKKAREAKAKAKAKETEDARAGWVRSESWSSRL
jgi:hypothetical protein